MDIHVKEYYRQYSDDSSNGNFHRVIALHEAPDISWEELSKLAPALPKGWAELARFPSEERIGFIKEYWLSKIPFRLGLDIFLERFFSGLDDIGIYITQKHFDDPMEAHLIYSIKQDAGFYSGHVPASEKHLQNLIQNFDNQSLPKDYLGFLQIHDGFCKTTDCTGVIPSRFMFKTYLSFQELVQGQDLIQQNKNISVDPISLIPFYESFGMPFFQCFWADWYPEEEMGNVYYSGTSKTISDTIGNESSPENLSFATFTDWLMFYLEPPA